VNNTKVVAISGVSGAGKTTLVKQLAQEFSCPFLLFDDHTDKETYPQNMKYWFESGANFSLIKTPKFVYLLEELLNKNSSIYIFIEEPFGKERDVMSTLIDYVILLDQPLELCLSRIIKRHIDHPHSDSLDSIASYLDKYDDHLREIYIYAANKVRNNCDLNIKQVTSIKITSNIINSWLKNKQKKGGLSRLTLD
jgi:uridine kinase